MTAKKPARRKAKPVIGWREWVSLPDLGVPAMKAKIDTGARSASLHAFDLDITEVDGVTVAHFVIHPAQRSRRGAIQVDAKVVGERRVRNPGGRTELRPVIRTTLAIGKRRLTAEVNLTRRDEMGFRMLLGRQTLRRRFLVDPGRSYRISRPPEDL